MMNRIQIIGLLLVCFAPASLQAQKDFDYAQALSEVDVFLERFVEYSDFREPMKNEVSGNARDQFKSLFKPNVYIKDLYNPNRMDQKGQYMPLLPFTDKNQPKIRTIDDFAEDVTRFCNHGISSKITGINADYSAISSGKVRLAIQRESSVRDYQDWRYSVYEELMLDLEWDAQEKRYIISAIDIADNYVVKCSNCEDRFAARVDPADDPAKPLKLWASIQGVAGVSAVSADQPQLTQLNDAVYAGLVAAESSLGKLTASGARPCWGVEGVAQLMKGYKHQWGASIGIGVFNTSAQLEQDKSTLVYQSLDQHGHAYNRRVQLEPTTITANLLTLYAPVQLHYSRRVNKKLKLHGALGVNLAFTGSLNSDQSAVVDYEALLKFQPTGVSSVTTTFTNDGSYDAVLAETTLTENQRKDETALRNYDVAFNLPLSDKTKAITTSGFALTARLGAGWMVNSSTEALISVGFMNGIQHWKAPSLVLADHSETPTFGSALVSAGEWKAMNVLVSGGVRFYLSSFSK